jgi:DNA polymerase III alpha subunit
LRVRDALDGKIESLDDFVKNVSPHIVNRKVLESLIKSGAMDSFADRSALLANIDNLLARANQYQRNAQTGQVDLFGNSTEMAPSTLNLNPPEIIYEMADQLIWERELLGLYLSHHPLDDYSEILSEKAVPLSELKSGMSGYQATIGGAIVDKREITTKNGAKMAFVKLADTHSEIEVIVFPKIYDKTADIWQRDQITLVSGRIDSTRDGEAKLIAEEARVIGRDEAKDYKPTGERKAVNRFAPQPVRYKTKPKEAAVKKTDMGRLYIRLEDSANQPLLIELKEALDGYTGSSEVVLVTGPTSNKQAIKLPQMIEINEESMRKLADIFGSTNVVVK